jgi:hypothetical protein
MSFCKYAFFDLSDIRFCLLSFNQEVCSRPCPYCDHYCPMGLCSPSLDASRYQCSTTSGSHLTCCFQGFCSTALARYSGDTAICDIPSRGLGVSNCRNVVGEGQDVESTACIIPARSLCRLLQNSHRCRMSQRRCSSYFFNSFQGRLPMRASQTLSRT